VLANAKEENQVTKTPADVLELIKAEGIQIVDVRFIDQASGKVKWEEPHFTGDTTYFALGANVETEAEALSRTLTDLARRIVERTVEDW